MAIAVPCGIIVAVLRLYGYRAGARASATGYVELFRNLPLILVVYWAFYVLPILTGIGTVAARDRPRGTRAERHGIQRGNVSCRASTRSAAASSRRRWRWA